MKAYYKKQTTFNRNAKQSFSFIFFVLIILPLYCGCVTRRGRDFGHILVAPAEHYPMQISVVPEQQKQKTIITRVLVLPPVGELPADLRKQLHLIISQQLQQLIPGAVMSHALTSSLAAYTTTAALRTSDGQINLNEAVRLGRLTDASHVLMVDIIECRPYPPQKLAMEWTVIDTQKTVALIKMIGLCDAAEQNTLAAADRFLLSRRSRPYEKANLDLIMNSPREYHSFVVAVAVEMLKDYIKGNNGNI